MSTIAKRKTGLTKKEELHALEAEIETGLEHVFRIGANLKRIRDRKLYPEDGFETWGDYQKKRWDFSRTRVFQLIKAADFREALPAFTNCEHEWRESHVREITRLETHLLETKHTGCDDQSKAAARAEAIEQAGWIGKHIVKEVAKPDGPKPSAGLVRKEVDKLPGLFMSWGTKEPPRSSKVL